METGSCPLRDRSVAATHSPWQDVRLPTAQITTVGSPTLLIPSQGRSPIILGRWSSFSLQENLEPMRLGEQHLAVLASGGFLVTAYAGPGSCSMPIAQYRRMRRGLAPPVLHPAHRGRARSDTHDPTGQPAGRHLPACAHARMPPRGEVSPHTARTDRPAAGPDSVGNDPCDGPVMAGSPEGQPAPR